MQARKLLREIDVFARQQQTSKGTPSILTKDWNTFFSPPSSFLLLCTCVYSWDLGGERVKFVSSQTWHRHNSAQVE